MSGQREKRAPQSMEKAFRMSATKPAAQARAVKAERPVRSSRPVMPESDYDEELPRRQRKVKQRKPFRLVKLVFTVVVLAWFFIMGVLVGRGTAPVTFDIDGLRNQLVTASAVISERVAQIGGGSDGTVDFYDSLGREGADIHISDPRNYRPEYSVAPEGDSLTAGIGDGPPEGGETPAAGVDDEVLLGDAAWDGKVLEPQVKPKTDFDGYVALKQAGSQVAAAQTPPQTQTPEVVRPAAAQTPAATDAERGGSAVVSGGGQAVKGTFSVQVAAVRGEAEAKAFLESLGKKGFSGRVEKTTVGEGVWYRVRVGVYQSRAQAEEDLQKLIKIGIKSPMIVTN